MEWIMDSSFSYIKVFLDLKRTLNLKPHLNQHNYIISLLIVYILLGMKHKSFQSLSQISSSSKTMHSDTIWKLKPVSQNNITSMHCLSLSNREGTRKWMCILLICQPSSCGTKGKRKKGWGHPKARPDKESHESIGTTHTCGPWRVTACYMCRGGE